MSEFVLEILNGDHAGDTFPLSANKVTVGRKSTCDVTLHDEKISGLHAEFSAEAGGWVLRDLESTNGTILDGRKVTELVLTPFDVIQFGRIRVVYREAGAKSVASSELQVHQIDDAILAQSRGRRGGIPGLVIVLVAVAGAGVWFVSQGQDGGGPGGGGAQPLRAGKVVGNKLSQSVASCEESNGWDLRVSGAGFQLGGPAHTGDSAFEAVRLDNDAGAAPGHALARTAESVPVLSSESLKFSAWVRTWGGGRGALRLRFHSSVDESIEELRSGTVPTAKDSYEQVELAVKVPSGMDRVDIEILALLPLDGATVLIDDLALVKGSQIAGFDLDAGGRKLVGSVDDFLIRSIQGPVFLRVSPQVGGDLSSLAAAGLLGLSDVATKAEVVAKSSGFSTEFKGEKLNGFVLEFPIESVSSGVLTRSSGGVFVAQAAEFSLAGVSEVLLGSGLARVMFRAKDASLSGTIGRDRYRLSVSGPQSFDLKVEFEAERTAARTALREAKDQAAAGRRGSALSGLRKVIDQFPHDDALAREARRLRSTLLLALSQSIEALDKELNQAEFFGAREGFASIGDELGALIESYGSEHLAQPDLVDAMRTRVDGALRAIDDDASGRYRRDLTALVEIFEQSGKISLAKLVKEYMAAHHGSGSSEDRDHRDGDGRRDR